MSQPSICVLKIQVPIAGDMTKALIYNQDSSINFLWPVEDVEDIMDGRLKAYFLATIDQDGKVSIEGEVEGHEW